MTEELKNEITQIAKDFASGFEPDIPSISGSGCLIVDPLSAFLNAQGYENELKQIPAKDGSTIVLVMLFKDGSMFIPSGGDLPGSSDWLWL